MIFLFIITFYHFYRGSYFTSNYTWESFDPPAAFFTGRFWDYGLDTDSDGKFNQIAFVIELNVSSGDENPCLAAIAASKKGVKVSEGEDSEEKKGTVEKTTESVTKGVKDAAEGLGKSFKKLFGK